MAASEESYFFRTILDDCFSKAAAMIFILKLVSAIFYEIFIFSPNDSPSNTIKNVFYFIEKALFVLEILKFL